MVRVWLGAHYLRALPLPSPSLARARSPNGDLLILQLRGERAGSGIQARGRQGRARAAVVVREGTKALHLTFFPFKPLALRLSYASQPQVARRVRGDELTRAFARRPRGCVGERNAWEAAQACGRALSEREARERERGKRRPTRGARVTLTHSTQLTSHILFPPRLSPSRSHTLHFSSSACVPWLPWPPATWPPRRPRPGWRRCGPPMSTPGEFCVRTLSLAPAPAHALAPRVPTARAAPAPSDPAPALSYSRDGWRRSLATQPQQAAHRKTPPPP